MKNQAHSAPETHLRTKLRTLNAPSMLVIALVLLITSTLISSTIAHTAVWLFIISILGGSMYALTNANDKRVVNGRLLYVEGEAVWREERSLAEKDFLAVGGLIGVAVTWVLLPLAYTGLSGTYDLQSIHWTQLLHDIITAFTAPIVVGSLNIAPIPLGFLWAGICTLFQTLSYLTLLRLRGITFYVLLAPIVYVSDVLIGKFVFNDPLSKQEYGFFIPLVLVLLLLIGLQKRFASPNDTEVDQVSLIAKSSWRARLQIIALVVLAITLNSATHVAQRGVIYGLGLVDPGRIPGVALAFRAAYFSVFAAYGIWWGGRKVLSRRSHRVWNAGQDQDRSADPPLTARAIRLATVTALTGGCALLLQAPAISSNLAVGPLAANSALIVAAPLVAAFYGVEGKSLQLLPRIRGAYGGQGNRRLGELGSRLLVGLGIILFVLLSFVMFLWTMTKLGVRLDLPILPWAM